MSVSPASSRAGWHTSQPAVPGRPPGGQRRPANTAAPMLTVTLNIPLACEESLTPAARRLLDAAREMLERGDAVVSAAVPAERRPDAVPAGRAPSRPLAPTIPTLHILASSRSVLRDGEPLPLTRLEFDLLLHLVAHPRRVFTRLQLLNAVWGYEHAGVRTVDVHVRRLRGKVGVDVPLVTTVYGVGYRLADDARVTIDRTG
ncbi:winged helix-turn-helix domain-containing protein [Micromonospora chalcea]|uniref:Winged helix family transcriptional regulator n=1 Tax=Micromonospora chalcea TaxID=1874 RepID=A0ABX9Y2K0_MICCH|nr:MULTISPECIES: winged helix-turn-helix domain-containing protein [Micromonospora]MBC8991695.1 winged helix-turn-helix transcriptional regulator [Micromonospora chalcea]MBQ1062238.1 winged helix-turn-helix transcriptional regulator [Micromonospora sp. C41]MBQ1069703.1 winged helix-turn-helix transcriptional regulator [Micromonospora sp. D75]MCK1806610.1 winged helix-turn-helix domain-containing protein [Micromonospora sp. R42106]MCK1833825.1 winged helix-turn-helix domain-containing protein [